MTYRDFWGAAYDLPLVLEVELDSPTRFAMHEAYEMDLVITARYSGDITAFRLDTGMGLSLYFNGVTSDGRSQTVFAYTGSVANEESGDGWARYRYEAPFQAGGQYALMSGASMQMKIYCHADMAEGTSENHIFQFDTGFGPFELARGRLLPGLPAWLETAILILPFVALVLIVIAVTLSKRRKEKLRMESAPPYAVQQDALRTPLRPRGGGGRSGP